MLTIRSHASDPAVVTVAELPDGVNEPASITFVVRNYNRDGKLHVHIFGGDPDQGEGDYPTIVFGSWDEHLRKFKYGDELDAFTHARRQLEQIIEFLGDAPEAQTLARQSLTKLNAAENTAWKES